MRDLRAAVMGPQRLSANLLLLAIVLFVAWGLVWAANAPLDEVVAGQGQVVPSGQVQVVQNLEGGIVDRILAAEGQHVEKDQLLLVIDSTQFATSYQENRSKLLGLMASAARLEAESTGGEVKFPEEVRSEAPALIANEQALMKARASEQALALGVLRHQLDQKTQERSEMNTRIGNSQRSLALARDEMRIVEPLVAKGVTSRLELLTLQRKISDLEGDVSNHRETLPRIASAIHEAQQKMDERKAAFRSEAQAQLNEVRVNISALAEVVKSAQHRLFRTDVKAPVSGIIKQIMVNTVGGVIQPGMNLVEIVPEDASLQVEARVRPSDIAFLRPRQTAQVTITAYDPSTYGRLEAMLEHISADTFVDDKGESFYKVRVRTAGSSLARDGTPLAIIPGMVAEVDIITGKRTVLDYLLQPILKARHKAMRER